MHILAVPSRGILTAVPGAFGRLQGSTGGFLRTTVSCHDSTAQFRPAAHPKEIAATRMMEARIERFAMIDRVDRRKAITNDKQSRTSAASMEGKVRGACLLLNPRATPEGARGERWGDCRNQNHNPYGLPCWLAEEGDYCSNVWNTQRVINTGCSMEAVRRSSPTHTLPYYSTEFLHTQGFLHTLAFLR